MLGPLGLTGEDGHSLPATTACALTRFAQDAGAPRLLDVQKKQAWFNQWPEVGQGLG